MKTIQNSEASTKKIIVENVSNEVNKVAELTIIEKETNATILLFQTGIEELYNELGKILKGAN